MTGIHGSTSMKIPVIMGNINTVLTGTMFQYMMTLTTVHNFTLFICFMTEEISHVNLPVSLALFLPHQITAMVMEFDLQIPSAS